MRVFWVLFVGLSVGILSFSNYADSNELKKSTKHIEIGNTHFEKGRYDWAIREYKKALTENPDYEQAYFNIARSYEKLNDFAKAVEFYQHVASLGKSNASMAHNNLALIYEKQAKLDEAIEEYKKAIEKNSSFAYAYNNVGNVYFQQGKYELALGYFRDAVKYDPKSVYGYSNLGNTLLKLNMLDEAIEQYNKALEIDPELPYALNNMGNAYVLKGLSDFALVYLKKSITYDSHNPYAWDNMGDAYMQLKKEKDALACYKKALGAEPNFFIVYYKLGKMYQADNPILAIENFQKFLEKSENTDLKNNVNDIIQDLKKQIKVEEK